HVPSSIALRAARNSRPIDVQNTVVYQNRERGLRGRDRPPGSSPRRAPAFRGKLRRGNAPNHKSTLLRLFEQHRATVGVIGLGYVGLPLGLAFAERGMRVLGFD